MARSRRNSPRTRKNGNNSGNKAFVMVYKYCDQRGVNILTNLRIKVSRPEDFNDPFEFTPKISGELSEAQTEALFADEDFVRWQLEIMELRGGKFPGGYDAFRKFFELASNRKELARHFPSHHLDTMRQLARKNL